MIVRNLSSVALVALLTTATTLAAVGQSASSGKTQPQQPPPTAAPAATPLADLESLANSARKEGATCLIWASSDLGVKVEDYGLGYNLLFLEGLRVRSLSAEAIPFQPAWRFAARENESQQYQKLSGLLVPEGKPWSAPAGSDTSLFFMVQARGHLTGAGLMEVFLVAPTAQASTDARPISNVLRLLVNIARQSVTVAK